MYEYTVKINRYYSFFDVVMKYLNLWFWPKVHIIEFSAGFFAVFG